MDELVDQAKNWLLGRVAVAERLANGECGGTYGDAVLVLSALVSGIAAELWPGEGLDRKRFVEIWARYGDASLHPNRISLPLLVEALRAENGATAEKARLLRSDCINNAPILDCLVVTGERVDVDENDVISAAPEIPLATIRKFSYGSVFYRHFRSGYVHQYKTGSHGDEYIMSHTRGDITYSNWLKAPHRRINFDLSWLIRLVSSICNDAIQDYWAGERSQPVKWWLDG